MKDRFSEHEALAAVAPLTRAKLRRFVSAEFVTPIHTDQGLTFRKLDLARLELLCDLSDIFEMQDDVLAVVISLIDQLHGARADLRYLLGIVDDQPDIIRGGILDRLKRRMNTE